LEEIHSSLINGQRKQAVEQIDKYGCYDFWSDYKDYVFDHYSTTNAFLMFTDMTIAYFRIKNR